jgi:hypothetical protein
MRAPYAWQCFACSAGNLPTADVCSACGFSARATGADIAAARAAKAKGAGPRSAIRDKSAFEAIAEALSPLPFWRQFLAVCGGLFLLGGLLWLKITFSFAGLAWSAVAAVVGLATMAVAFAGHNSPASPVPQGKGNSLLANGQRNGSADG